MELNKGDRVRIDEYGGDSASSNDKLLNGRTGVLESDPADSHYLSVRLDEPLTTSQGVVWESVLCDPVELTVI